MSDGVTLVVCARVADGSESAFARWQSQWQQAVLSSGGALSCDLIPAQPPDQEESIALVRFPTPDALKAWRQSDVHQRLVAEVAPLVVGGSITQLAGAAASVYDVQRNATELIVTRVRAGKESAYRAWADRIGGLQNAAPGFSGASVNAPSGNDGAWTTLLRFDTMQHLNDWLASPARLELLKEAEELTDDVVVQRFDTAFPGWAPNDPTTGKPPAAWRTACLILLVLLPIVMLEINYLDKHLMQLNRALWALIDVGLGVTLSTWPLMPTAVRVYRGWLYPENCTPAARAGWAAAVAGTFLLEMGISWFYVH
jgi:antibiotic biosynthesis monooxygenase (ABM) superfamily enzyme